MSWTSLAWGALAGERGHSLGPFETCWLAGEWEHPQVHLLKGPWPQLAGASRQRLPVLSPEPSLTRCARPCVTALPLGTWTRHPAAGGQGASPKPPACVHQACHQGPGRDIGGQSLTRATEQACFRFSAPASPEAFARALCRGSAALVPGSLGPADPKACFLPVALAAQAGDGNGHGAARWVTVPYAAWPRSLPGE